MLSDIYGNSAIITNYNVYFGTNSLFAPDLAGHTNRLGLTNGTQFIHAGVLTNPSPGYYYITAQAADGTEGVIVSNLLGRFLLNAAGPAGTNVFFWLAVPSSGPWSNASSLAAALSVTGLLYRLNDTSQAYEVWDSLASTGQNFTTRGGEAYGLELPTSRLFRLYGRYDPVLTNTWAHYTNRFNHHWLSLPPNTPYSDATALAGAIPGSTRVSMYDSGNGSFLNWFKLSGSWAGTNFPLDPTRGVLVSVASNSVWQFQNPYPQAAVSLVAGAGFIDLDAMQASGSVTEGSSALSEYAWDYLGDGTIELSNSVPLAMPPVQFTNAATAYPTYRVRDTRGFYAIGYARYEALTMSLGFDGQAFRPGYGETSLISFASSTGGYFTTLILDSNGNVIRTLETNAFHNGGYFRSTGDDAGDPLYNGVGNFDAVNGGSGLGPWTLSPASNDSTRGWFIGSSTSNASPSSGGIDGASGRAWGGYANNGTTASAYRALSSPMTVGETFSLDMDNGWVWSNSTVGVSLQNASSQSLVEVYYRGFDSTGRYKANDGSGEHAIDVDWTPDGLHLEITLASSSAYSGLLRVSGGTNVPFSGVLMNPAGGQVIAQIRLFNANGAGTAGGSPYDVFWNKMKVLGVPSASLAWDGRDGLGQVVSNGIYYFVVDQTVNGSTVRYDPKPLLLGSNITESVTAISVPAQFNPYEGGLFPIEYALPVPSWVTVLIQDNTLSTIAVVCSNALRAAGPHVEYWDGRLTSGAMLATGTSFSVSIDATAAGANGLIVQPALPALTGLTASMTKFTPSENPYGLGTNSVTCSYHLDHGADVRIIVSDAQGQVVQDALEPGKAAGDAATIWSGTDSQQRRVAPGLYNISLSPEVSGQANTPQSIWVEAYY